MYRLVINDKINMVNYESEEYKKLIEILEEKNKEIGETRKKQILTEYKLAQLELEQKLSNEATNKAIEALKE